MIHPIRSFSSLLLVFSVVTSGKETDTQGTEIVYTADKRICQNITWKLESHAVYVELTKVLHKGDGKERQVHSNVLTSGLVNVTTTSEICCPGFYKKHKGKCERCPTGTYGLDCLNRCDCIGFRKCDRRTGECKKCREKPCEDDDGNGDGSTVSNTINSKITDLSIPVQTTTDSKNKNVLSTIRTCGACKEFGNCSSELQCSELSDLYDSDTSRNTDKWTIISIVLSISVIGNVIAFVLGFIRYQRRRQRKQSQIASVIQLSNEVNNAGENIMVESSHEYLQMTDDCHSYNALDNNRAYVSMYNEIKDLKQYTNDLKPTNIERETETTRHSVDNDYDTVE